MYVRDGKQMQYREEGAAFFEPVRLDVGMIPPRTMGLQPGMLTHGFVPTYGIGQYTADAVEEDPSSIPVLAAAVSPSAPPPDHVPWLFGIGAAIGGFILFSGKRRR